ncbi:MAG: 30S ribosomal protein S17 [Candidatus Altiarchaeota archaeon]
MECSDVNCPKHGTLATRGMVLDGIVVSDKMNKTVVVERSYFVKVRKYDRFKRARSKIPAHNPECVKAKTGDRVRIMECRRLSKTVSFVVTEVLSSEKVTEKKEAEPKEKTVKPKAAKKKTVRKKKEVAENG